MIPYAIREYTDVNRVVVKQFCRCQRACREVVVMVSDVKLLTMVVPNDKPSVPKGQLITEPLPSGLRIHPEASLFGPYDVSGRVPSPTAPLFSTQANRPQKQIETIFDLYESLRLNQATDVTINAKPLNQDFISFVRSFSNISLSDEKIIHYMPMYSEGRDREIYRHWAYQSPRYILYLGRFEGEHP